MEKTNSTMKTGEVLDLRRFAQKLGYRGSNDREFNAILKNLTDREMVEIQQSGFVADSTHHIKLVAILKPLELDHFRRVILTRTGFKIADYHVHRATKRFKCNYCYALIEPGQRYGSKVRIGRKANYTKHRPIFEYEISCLPCLMQRFPEEFE